MAITKELIVDKVTVVGDYKNIEVRTVTVIKEDNVEISRSFHRHTLTPSNCMYTPAVAEVKDEDGKVYRHASLKHIDFSKGNWLVLGRTKKIRKDIIENFFLEQGYWFGQGDKRPVAQSVIDAIFTWKRLKSGQQINLKSAIFDTLILSILYYYILKNLIYKIY